MIRTTIATVLLMAASLHAGSLELQGDLKWVGAPTSDGDATWPASLEVMFDPEDFEKANVRLSGMPYSGAWMTQDFVMTTADSRIFGTTDSTVTLEMEMSPLSELSESTLENITDLRFQWAHPLFNDPVAPQSWLVLEGKPEIVPEPSLMLFSLALLPALLVGLIRRK